MSTTKKSQSQELTFSSKISEIFENYFNLAKQKFF